MSTSQKYCPSESNLRARDWFQDAKFGLFIHWGLYSLLGRGEWVMYKENISAAEYEKLAERFNPVQYDPAEWVRLAKRAGMRYITFTSKHHEGFAMWDSRVSEFNVVKKTPYGKDVLRMLAEECRRQDMPLFLYHSHLDWHHPDYFPYGWTGGFSGRPAQGDFDRYLDFMDAQLAELFGGEYGDLAGAWFDGWWEQRLKNMGRADAGPLETQVDWRLEQTYRLIHSLQPHALIGNNHRVPPFDGEDFQMFEKDLPGQNNSGLNADSKIGALPLEMCETIGTDWGYSATETEKDFKSVAQLIAVLVNAAGADANLLLNVGPTPEGTFHPGFAARLKEIGEWLGVNGESIYGTRGGPMPPQPWGCMTQKANAFYVHVLDAQPGAALSLPGLDPARIRSARFLHGGAPVDFNTVNGVLALTLPDALPCAYDSVIVLDR